MGKPELLAEVAHRPWPLPARSHAMHMRWLDLCFLHWPVDPAAIRPHVPAGLEVDTHGGSAWLGVVPFRMTGVRPRFCPSIPGVSAFPELNLRTYVTDGARPGVWFYSLDVPNLLPVVLARTLFHLPYFHARMSFERDGDWIRYSSEGRDGRRAFDARYRGTGERVEAPPGSLDAWLTERYCLYSADRGGRVFRGDVHHTPWPLERADFELERNELAAGLGVELEGAPLAHFSRELDVVAWTLRRVAPR